MRKDKITDSQNVGEQLPIRFDFHSEVFHVKIFNLKILKWENE